MTSNLFWLVFIKIIACVSCKYTGDIEETKTVTTGRPDFSNVKMHSACNQTYCFELPEDYPDKLITTLLKKEKFEAITETVLGHRGVTDYSVVEPCKVKRTVQPIFQIRDENNFVRFVVQSEEFKQIVSVEECSNPGEIVGEDVPFDMIMLKRMYYKAVCAQTYYNYTFLVLSLDGKRLEHVRIGNKGVPISCQCEIQGTE